MDFIRYAHGSSVSVFVPVELESWRRTVVVPRSLGLSDLRFPVHLHSLVVLVFTREGRGSFLL